MIEIDWTRMKAQLALDVPYNWTVLRSGDYMVWIHDGMAVCSMLSSQAEKDEFDADYMAGASLAMPREPITGLPQWQERGVDGTACFEWIYVTTGSENIDAPSSAYSASVAADGKSTAVRFSPDFQYYLKGGCASLVGQAPSGTVKLDLIFMPDIPEESGGKWPFLKNLLVHGTGWTYRKTTISRRIDSEAPAARELDIVIRHEIGESVKIGVCLDIYVIA